jgi:hypothetical protein
MVQRNRDQHIGQNRFMQYHVFTEQVTHYPAGRQLAFELEGLYQAVGGKFVQQGANGAGKGWRFPDTGAANFIPGGTERQTATEAVWTVPGQICPASGADAYGSRRLATEHTTGRQNEILHGLPPAPVNLDRVYRLTGHHVLFILHAPARHVAAHGTICEAGVVKP